MNEELKNELEKINNDKSLHREGKIAQMIDAIVTETPTPWKTISGGITESGMKVKNWLDVRGVLQWMIDEKFVVRTKDVHSEEYVRIG